MTDSCAKIFTYRPGNKVKYDAPGRRVLVGGCFDILHYGHISFLEKARLAGDYLIVALEADERISQHKGRDPVHTQQERAYNLAALRWVDAVVLLPELNGYEDYLQLAKDVSAQVIAITEGDLQRDNKKRQADEVGAHLITVIEQVGEFSSSQIYKNITTVALG